MRKMFFMSAFAALAALMHAPLGYATSPTISRQARLRTSVGLNRSRHHLFADTYKMAADISTAIGVRSGPLR